MLLTLLYLLDYEVLEVGKDGLYGIMAGICDVESDEEVEYW